MIYIYKYKIYIYINIPYTMAGNYALPSAIYIYTMAGNYALPSAIGSHDVPIFDGENAIVSSGNQLGCTFKYLEDHPTS